MGSEEPVSDTPWRALHPASLAVNLLPQAWRTFRGLWPLLLFLLLPGRDRPLASDLILLLGMVGSSVLMTAIHFFTLRYRLHAGRLEVRSGLLNRRTRTMDPARIQNIALVQNPFHKLAGLVELRLDLAGDPSSDGLLSALSVAEAQRLRSALEAARGPAQRRSEAPEPPTLANSILELLAFGLSGRRLGPLALLSAAAAEGLNLLAPHDAQALTRSLGPRTLLAAFFLALAASWVLGAASAWVRHAGFRLVRAGDRLITEEGLITRRRVEIPLAKVQLALVEEPPLRRLMGYGTVNIETAALGFEEGHVRRAEAMLPMVPTESLCGMVAAAVPSLSADPWTTPLLPAHRAALPLAIAGALLRASVWAVAFAVLAWSLLGPWGLLSFGLVPLVIPLGWLDWRQQGWRITDATVVARRGVLRRRTWVLSRAKVQSAVVVQSPLLRLVGLGQVLVRAAGSAVVLPPMGVEEAVGICEGLTVPNREDLRRALGAWPMDANRPKS